MTQKTTAGMATRKVLATDHTTPTTSTLSPQPHALHTESHREWHLLATYGGNVVYTIDDLKTNRDAQIMVGSIVFFLLAFPIYCLLYTSPSPRDS